MRIQQRKYLNLKNFMKKSSFQYIVLNEEFSTFSSSKEMIHFSVSYQKVLYFEKWSSE